MLLLITLAVLAGIGYLKYLQIVASMATPPPPESPVAVTLAEAQPVTFRRTSVVVGSVLSPQSITLRTELTGVITSVSLVPGGIVQKDDTLLQLDDRTERAALKGAIASLKLAESEVKRAEQLRQSNANSLQELERARAEAVAAEAEVERLMVLIDKKKMRAPFDARVGLFDVHVGQYLTEGTQITMLEGIDDYLHIDFAMPAHIADEVQIGESIVMQAQATGDPLAAEIIAIDAHADPVSRSVTARAKLLNPPLGLLPGDSVRITVQYGQALAAVEIPATAVRRGPTGSMVFVAVDRDGVTRAQGRGVVIAGGGDNEIRILQGIVAGEKVVADGSFKVTEGAMLANEINH